MFTSKSDVITYELTFEGYVTLYVTDSPLFDSTFFRNIAIVKVPDVYTKIPVDLTDVCKPSTFALASEYIIDEEVLKLLQFLGVDKSFFNKPQIAITMPLTEKNFNTMLTLGLTYNRLFVLNKFLKWFSKNPKCYSTFNNVDIIASLDSNINTFKRIHLPLASFLSGDMSYIKPIINDEVDRYPVITTYGNKLMQEKVIEEITKVGRDYEIGENGIIILCCTPKNKN